MVIRDLNFLWKRDTIITLNEKEKNTRCTVNISFSPVKKCIVFLEKRQITSLLLLAIYHALVECYHSIIENDYPSPDSRGASERGGIMDGKRVKRE